MISHQNQPEDGDLDHPSSQGHFRGVKIEPADKVVVEDVDDVGEQNQGHSLVYCSPFDKRKTSDDHICVKGFFLDSL